MNGMEGEAREKTDAHPRCDERLEHLAVVHPEDDSRLVAGRGAGCREELLRRGVRAERRKQPVLVAQVSHRDLPLPCETMLGVEKQLVRLVEQVPAVEALV